MDTAGSPTADSRRRRPVHALLLASTLLVTACAGSTDALVTVERSDQAGAVQPDDPTATTEPGDDDPATTDEPGRNDTIDPVDPKVTDTTLPDIDVSQADENAIDFGENKPERDYDDFLLAALSDIDIWLGDEFEPAFGQPWEPLAGSVVAGYPERTTELPGCGEPTTSYPDLQLFVAFYCPLGDFIVYDDGEDGLLARLARDFGPATIGIVLAHEYGHALQERTGDLQRDLATVVTEQQADCVAGAWAGRASAGEASGIPFTDADIRAGLISMITVQDPVGLDPNQPGGHGSGFDRVGAFQFGFNGGLASCAPLIDDPLPLVPVAFVGEQDFQNQGDAPFGFEEGELFDFLVPDLNLLYDNDLQADFPDFTRLELVPVQSADEMECDEPFGLFELGADLCSETNTVYLNEPVAFERYTDFGDFAPGYLLGFIWAEAAQRSNGEGRTGEERQLRNDCLAGAWVRTVTPDSTTGALPEPRDPDRLSSISPNDTTEAIQFSIFVGDPSSDTDVLGTPFEKIDAFRAGALGGLDAC